MSNNVNLHDVDLQESSMLNDQPNRSSVSQMEYDMTKRPQQQPQPQAPGGYSATIASPPTTIHLPPPEGSPHPPIIHLNLRTLTGQMMAVELPHTVGVTTVGNLKSAVEATHGIPVSFQRLIFAGRELQDANTLVSYGIEDGYTVHLLLRQNQPTPEQQAQYAAAAAANPQAIPPGVAVAIPIHAMPMAIAPEAAERMTITYQLGRYVKMFAVIDAIFAVIWSFTFWPAAIGVFLAICGYYGAQNYQRKFVALYAIYLILSIALRIYWITSSVPLIYIFILAIGIIIEFYILHLVWKFMRVLKHLTYDERMELISMRHRGGFMG